MGPAKNRNNIITVNDKDTLNAFTKLKLTAKQQHPATNINGP